MGQCYGKIKVKRWQRRRQFGHKRFDFTPKRSWKYKDAHVLNEFHNMSLEGSDGDNSNPEGRSAFVVENKMATISDSEGEEEELDSGAGEVRQGGRLVFSEEDETLQDQATHLQVRIERSLSNGQEKIGRFEVMDIPTPCHGSSDSEGEEVKEEKVVSEIETANLMENDALA